LKPSIRKLLFLTADWLLYNAVLVAVYHLKFKGLPGSYFKMLLFMNGLWIIDLIFGNKHHMSGYATLSDRLYVVLKSCVFMIFCTAVVLSLMHQVFPRFFLLKIYGGVFILEAAAFTVLHLIRHSGRLFPAWSQKKKHHFDAVKFVYDAVLYAVAVIAVCLLKYGNLNLSVGSTLYISGLFALNVIISDWTGKYSTLHHKNPYFALSNYVRSAAVVFSLVAFGVIVLSVDEYSRGLLFGPIVALLVLEIGVFEIRHYVRAALKTRDVVRTADVEKIIRAERMFEEAPSKKAIPHPADEVLRERLAGNRALYRFIGNNLNLLSFDYRELFLCTFDPERIFDAIHPSSLRLLICLHRINDIGQINRFFLSGHTALKNGGYLVGVKETLESTKNRLFRQYPRSMATALTILVFLVSRVWPKLPVIKHVHFLIFRGKNNPISKAELFGRLSFCGYQILDSQSIENRLYFIAKKIKMPSLDRNPSFGPLITLKRIGYQGQPIFIKKLRTMHPYSEYIQDYIVEKNRLQSNGKIKDDFRVTGWGKWLRRHWIDELPQIVNWLKGDITLVGVRALSEQYFLLYPEDLRELRIQFKPGLIPPYYVDMPESFEEIVESERRYLQKKQTHPFVTDILYFSKAFVNIVFRKARSR
jgi:lipopolysaccharide/colanic/teichoic acid biosynthesis glycosyltransferase